MMTARKQITMDPELKRRAQARAAQLGISFAEYIRRLMESDLGEVNPDPGPKADISIIFDLVNAGPPTNIARDKDKMLGEAVWEDYLRKTGRRPRRKATSRTSRR
jgi:hypothetical protein